MFSLTFNRIRSSCLLDKISKMKCSYICIIYLSFIHLFIVVTMKNNDSFSGRVDSSTFENENNHNHVTSTYLNVNLTCSWRRVWIDSSIWRKRWTKTTDLLDSCMPKLVEGKSSCTSENSVRMVEFSFRNFGYWQDNNQNRYGYPGMGVNLHNYWDSELQHNNLAKVRRCNRFISKSYWFSEIRTLGRELTRYEPPRLTSSCTKPRRVERNYSIRTKPLTIPTASFRIR